jgi:hypothetical protein
LTEKKERRGKEKEEEEAGVCPSNVVFIVEAIGVMASVC